MAPNFSKNAILEGCVPSDYFCLVCEIYFTSAVKCDEHISGSDHKEKMNSISYVEKFKEDGIKKIKNKYFCELCNQLMYVLARVKLHVNETSHIKKKYTGWLKRIDNVVVAFDSIMIDDTSWQGLCDSSCTICNLEYDDEDAHKNSSTHMLNLIQSKVEFDKNKNIYRKIDDNSIQCLTCNLVQTLDNNHFDSPQHKQMIQVASDGYQAMTQSNKYKVNVNEKTKMIPTYVYDDKAEEKICKGLSAENYISHDENNVTWCILCDWFLDVSLVRKHINGEHHKTLLNMHKKRLAALEVKNSNSDDDNEQQNNTLLDFVDKFQSNGININFEAQTAVCKKCLTNLKLDHDAIEKHVLSHNKQLKKGKKSFQLKFPNIIPERKGTLVSSPVFLKPRGVEQPSDGNSSKSSEVPNDFSDTASSETFLDVEPPSTSKIKKTKDPMPEKIPLKDFIESVIGVKSIIFKDVVINNKFCINNFSFVFLNFSSDDIVIIRCYACDEQVSYGAFETHSNTPKHERAMRDSLVLTQHDTEFIRETLSGCFHCGFCNIIETSWNGMEDHLKTSMHIESKNDASWRLQQYQPVFLQTTSPRTVVNTLCTNMITMKFL